MGGRLRLRLHDGAFARLPFEQEEALGIFSRARKYRDHDVDDLVLFDLLIKKPPQK